MEKNNQQVAIFCVNYNTYKELVCFYDSVCRAAEQVQGRMEVHFFVADNTECEAQEISLEGTSNVSPKVFAYNENLGYLGAAQRMMREEDVDVLQYDYVAISNVDLVMQDDALLRLCECKVSPTTGWIAPALLSEQEGRDRNPGVMRRYSARRLKMLRVMFRFPILTTAYRATLYRRHKIQRHYPERQVIYAGHGSFMLFTKAYFEHCGLPQFPMFLFGEELYFAEQCRTHGLKVVYCPSIRIKDQEHASIGKMHRPTKYRYNYESLGYILRTFY